MSRKVTKIAEYLLKIKAVKLQPDAPFTWASGWKSPVYCDNRLSLSYPEVRDAVRDALVALAREDFPEIGGVAGVATAGIPQGALLADRLGLPYIYIRSGKKKHGLTNRIEGRVERGLSYLVIEDLVSTGGSSLSAAEALREAGGTVAGIASVFTYGFPQAAKAFAEAGVRHESLIDLDDLLEKALEIDYIQPADLEVIRKWRQDPEEWSARAVNA